MANNDIFINDYKNVVEKDFKQVSEVEWHGITLHIKKHLSFEEMMTFVNDVVSSCFASDTNEYLPEIKDFSTRCSILESYAGITLPSSLSEKFDMVYSSDVVSFIVHHVDHNQINAMLSAIDSKIEHQAQNNIELMNKQISDVITNFSMLEKKLSDIFSGIDNATITGIAGAISRGSIDENKIVKALIDEKYQKDKIIPMPLKVD